MLVHAAKGSARSELKNIITSRVMKLVGTDLLNSDLAGLCAELQA